MSPEDEDAVLHTLWILLRHREESVGNRYDGLDAIEIRGAYDLLNRIGYTTYRPTYIPEEGP